ncbi:ABC transporter permease subunit [Defluviimonas sp. WL0002]|uniref:ABC transporter permease subunit n=1 Tax=Albidovulum marisflavi TaxID=2984159 RepID=A0ABT2ZDX3_9RHOB|nr:ABC transporter permease subunit [Defluviimonas sp. WL0002]MCV2869338.1 ABC transporter permease subunit [Defluviimonas sp. WL0002]
MAYVASTPKEPFRLSMLVYDTRYRSYTIQIVVLLLFLAFLAWLLNNTVENLAAKDKDINFSFLFQRAGYDIDQQLIPYTNDSTHGRALFVGLLNTLIVAFFGCILATLIGVFAGVLRLSHNWVVSRLMTVYVETFRNVPLLLWIILAFVVFSETAPAPRDFRVTEEMAAAGEEPAASKILFDSVAFTNRGASIPRPYLDHSLGSFSVLDVPINLSVVAALALIAVGVWINRRLVVHARSVQEATGVRPTIWWKSLLILFGPIIVFLYALGFHLEYPELRGFNFQGGINVAHSFTALLIALSLYTGAFIAEAVRAGILAISKGQTEAAYALGLRPGRTMRLVVLPQALRVIVPPLISQYLNLTKNTTLGMAISYLDLKGTLGGITLNQTGRELESMLLMMAIYLVLSLIISSGMNVYNTAMKLKER